MIKHPDDQEIIKLCKQKDSLSYGFSLLVRKYQERLYAHIRKMVLVHEDADDLLQQTFIKAWKGIAQFREESQLYTWLYRIASNECLTFLKKKKIKNIFSLSQMNTDLIHQLEADVFFEGDQLELTFQKALLSLPEKQKLVFNMRFYEEMKFEEISGILGTSVGALKASYHLAKEKIQKYIHSN